MAPTPSTPVSISPERRPSGIYYGWWMALVGFCLWGFGLGPAYYSWSFYSNATMKELDFDHVTQGWIWGTFQMVYSLAGVLSSVCIHRFGMRATVTTGSFIAAFGMLMQSRAQSVEDCFIAFAGITGIGIGLSSQIPSQTIASQWFRRYRARALALIVGGGGLTTTLVAYFNEWTLEHGGWRQGWQMLACLSVAVGCVVAVLARNSPASMGQVIDGGNEPPGGSKIWKWLAATPARASFDPGPWKTKYAILTWPFILITLSGVASSGIWSMMSSHWANHFRELGFGAMIIAHLATVRSVSSTAGRMAGVAGDYMSPSKLVGMCLTLLAIGLLGFAAAESVIFAGISFGILAFGYGGMLICLSHTLAYYFGAGAFPGVKSVSNFVQGFARFLAPPLVGLSMTRTGSFTMAFIIFAGIAAAAAVGAFLCPPPRRIEPEPERGPDKFAEAAA